VNLFVQRAKRDSNAIEKSLGFVAILAQWFGVKIQITSGEQPRKKLNVAGVMREINGTRNAMTRNGEKKNLRPQSVTTESFAFP